MTKMKALIIDDERYARDELKHLLKETGEIEVVGEAENGEQGIMLALKTQPDVVFIDVEMPKMNGLEVAKSVKQLKTVPLIVFATAYPDFAADAFRVEAVDYLVKPFSEEQLDETISRVKRLLSVQTPQDVAISKSKLAIEDANEIHYVDPSQILYIFREDNITRIIGLHSEYETKTSLKELESRLRDVFFRIHKSYLVNLDYVTRLIPWFNGAYQLEMKGQKELLPISRNYVKSLRARLEL